LKDSNLLAQTPEPIQLRQTLQVHYKSLLLTLMDSIESENETGNFEDRHLEQTLNCKTDVVRIPAIKLYGGTTNE